MAENVVGYPEQEPVLAPKPKKPLTKEEQALAEAYIRLLRRQSRYIKKLLTSNG